MGNKGGDREMSKKKVKLEPYALKNLAEDYYEVSRENSDFHRGYLYGIRYVLLCLFGWSIGYDDDAVIRIRNRKGKVIYEEV